MNYRRYIVTKSFVLPNGRPIGRGTVFDFRFIGKGYFFLDSLESYLSITGTESISNNFYLFVLDNKTKRNSFCVTREQFFNYLNQKIFLKIKDGELN
jgi:hypothetical protein